MKKYLCYLLCLIMFATFFSACNDKKTEEKNGKLSIVTTIFPQYDWTENIIGELKDDVELTLTVKNGVDIHSFQPSVDDIIKISNCDIIIYVGGESDKWVEDVLKYRKNKDMKIINLLNVLGEKAKQEEFVEGMQKEKSGNDDEVEFDEHIWLSVKNAEIFCNAISDAICEKDRKNEKNYKTNCKRYLSKINDIDKKYESAVKNSQKNVLLFADRFPFRYLIEDYNLKYYAAFAGCSAESEASFETIRFLAEKIDELNLKYVLTLDGDKINIADAVISASKNKNAEILQLNSMQSIISSDMEKGIDYCYIMENNLEVLKKVLG